MSSPDPSDHLYDSHDQWDPYDDPSQQQTQEQQTQANQLKLCQLLDWDSERIYDEDPPISIHYSIEWKVSVNNRAIMPKDTEQDIVLAPAAYWQHFLEPKLQNLLRKKNRPLRSEDTQVVVSVTERSERDITKRFDDTTIDWATIERQLVAWGELYRVGKRLRLNLTFNYVDTSQSSTTSDKRGSTTRQMLTEGAAQLDAEQASVGRPSPWRDVYNLMRCPGPPCHLGPHCWRDPVGKKHYKLNTHHLKSLIMHVQDGHTLKTHDDVPEDIREQLYAEEQQSLERHQKASRATRASTAPITITNVLPAPPYQTPHQVSSLDGPSASDMILKSTPIDRLNIPGPRDEAVEEYCTWQKSQVKKPALKVEYQKACDVILEDGIDLEQIYQKPNPDFLIKRGVKRGIAERVVSGDDIRYWVKKYKQAGTEE
jgi:hypothetical protein